MTAGHDAACALLGGLYGGVLGWYMQTHGVAILAPVPVCLGLIGGVGVGMIYRALYRLRGR